LKKKISNIRVQISESYTKSFLIDKSASLLNFLKVVCKVAGFNEPSEYGLKAERVQEPFSTDGEYNYQLNDQGILKGPIPQRKKANTCLRTDTFWIDLHLTLSQQGFL
jgi:hypothetical protein